jgi:hypothetical protein
MFFFLILIQYSIYIDSGIIHIIYYFIILYILLFLLFFVE